MTKLISVTGRLTWLVCAGAAFVALTVFEASAEKTQSSQTKIKKSDKHTGTVRMVARLEELATRLEEKRPLPNLHLNDKRAEILKTLIARESNPEVVLKGRLILARELLYAGNTEEAIAEYESLLPRIDRMTAPQLWSQLTSFLGLAYMRLGEQENCLLNHTSESCLLPIRGTGIHKNPRGSRRAIQIFEEMLGEDSTNLRGRWLLNLAYMTLGEYPAEVPAKWLIPFDTFDSEYDIKRFPDVAAPLDVNVLGLSGGAAMEDFDGDGYLDIIASGWGLREQIRYLHNNRDGSFSDHTEQANLTGITGGLNLVHADYNNDGFPDLFVLRGAWLREQGKQPNSLLKNNGDGTFDDVTEEAGVLSFHPTQTAAWFDYNNDGWLDLFVGNETEGPEDHPCELFHNNGDGTFAEVAAEVGVANLGWVKGVAWGDYDNDGRIDIYLSRLGEPNVLYRNLGARAAAAEDMGGSSLSGKRRAVPFQPWSFVDVAPEAGVTMPLGSFPTWFFDYDNDGWLDLFVSGWQGLVADVASDYLELPHRGGYPRLYRNQGDGAFEDVTERVNLRRLLLAMGSNFGDLDNDGYLDFYLATGSPDLAMLIPNVMLRNAEGRFFQGVTASGGFGHLQKGHGVAFGDIDNDGDQDIYTVIGGAYSGDVYWNTLFENPGHGNHWITLMLEGVQSNRYGVGARIRVRVETPKGEREIHVVAGTGGSFGSSSLRQEIGLGNATAIRQIEILWPGSQHRQVWQGVKADQILELREGDPDARRARLRSLKLQHGDGSKRPHDHHPVRKIVEGALGPQDGLARTGKRRPKSPPVSSADRAKLRPILVPDISGMDDTIHEQVQQAESFLKSVQRKRDVSKEELSEAYGELGKLYHTYSFSEAAVLCYQNAEYLTPGDFRWPYYLGRLHEEDYGGVQDALDSYERAVKIRPTDVPALLRLAGLRLEQDQPELAKPLFEKVLVLDNSSVAALFGLGRVAARERDYARAVEHFERVLALQPQASGAHYRLAIVYRHLRDVARAREHLAKSGHQSPTIADPLMDEVLAMKRGGAHKIDLLTRATAAYNSSDFAKATELYSKVVEADPEYPRARVQLGSALAAMGDWEAALEQYQEALRLSPTNSRAHYDIGLIHTWRGEGEEAIERYRAALESDPERKQAHFQLANELMRVKRHEEAVPHYAKVVELDPRNEFAHLMHAMALVRVGHYAEARARLQESYAAFPGNPNIANALARVLAASPDEGVRDGTRALELAEQMVKNRQNLDLDYVVTFAMALAEVGQFDRAAHGQSLMISQAKDAGQQDLVDLLDDDLALYQQGKPSRLPWKPDDPVFYPVPKKMAATDLLVDTTPVEPAGGSK